MGASASGRRNDKLRSVPGICVLKRRDRGWIVRVDSIGINSSAMQVNATNAYHNVAAYYTEGGGCTNPDGGFVKGGGDPGNGAGPGNGTGAPPST
ncbi:MAG: hypothetical protein MMC23_008727 [Stictis urceolatum]|nr:hypothetical protein [Stictis urceolata]